MVILSSALTALAQDSQDAAILKCRESVWRPWFANDTKTLHELIPPEAIAISPREDQWETQADVFRGAVEFQSQGSCFTLSSRAAKYNVAAMPPSSSEFDLEMEVGGKRSLATGRATEVFVLRNGHWINYGWHTDSHKQK
ncbi:MAG TPA: hypothetical protein VMF10_02280 [Candidatus Aquilonibacter sp.]|nr:hypothetical protein [Candidatus Aquilonibacter sp.]